MFTLPKSEMLVAGLLGAFLSLLAGCATNMTHVAEELYHEDGTPSSVFSFDNKNIVTWGSKQEQGTGTMHYEGDGWKLDANGGATGQTAGTVNAADLAGLIQMIQALQALIPTKVEPVTP